MFYNFPKICATCKHLRTVEVGREFEKIIDTEYTSFTCAVLGWQVKEYYLMVPVGDIFSSFRNYQECPHWEYWTEEASAPGSGLEPKVDTQNSGGGRQIAGIDWN